MERDKHACLSCGTSWAGCASLSKKCCEKCWHTPPKNALKIVECAVAGCSRSAAVLVKGKYPMDEGEPLEVEALICAEHGREFGGPGGYSVSLLTE